MVYHLPGILRVPLFGGGQPPNKITSPGNEPSCDAKKGPKARGLYQLFTCGLRGSGGRTRWGGLGGGCGWRRGGGHIDDDADDVCDIIGHGCGLTTMVRDIVYHGCGLTTMFIFVTLLAMAANPGMLWRQSYAPGGKHDIYTLYTTSCLLNLYQLRRNYVYTFLFYRKKEPGCGSLSIGNVLVKSRSWLWLPGWVRRYWTTTVFKRVTIKIHP